MSITPRINLESPRCGIFRQEYTVKLGGNRRQHHVTWIDGLNSRNIDRLTVWRLHCLTIDFCTTNDPHSVYVTDTTIIQCLFEILTYDNSLIMRHGTRQNDIHSVLERTSQCVPRLPTHDYSIRLPTRGLALEPGDLIWYLPRKTTITANTSQEISCCNN